MTIKTDNANLSCKLHLRAYFLDKYHGKGATVFDACMATGALWRQLQTDRRIVYWGTDRNPANGRLKIESERVLETGNHGCDVIDIDTYGLPWKHWNALLIKADRIPLTVFLTVGSLTLGGSTLSDEIRKNIGLGRLEVPNAIAGKLNKDFTEDLIARAHIHGWHIVDCQEVIPTHPSSARYFGVRLVPGKEFTVTRAGGKTSQLTNPVSNKRTKS